MGIESASVPDVAATTGMSGIKYGDASRWDPYILDRCNLGAVVAINECLSTIARVSLPRGGQISPFADPAGHSCQLLDGGWFQIGMHIASRSNSDTAVIR